MTIVFKFIIAGLFVLLGLCLLWYGVSMFNIPSVFLWLYGGFLVVAALASIGMGFLVFTSWNHMWVRVLVIIIASLPLLWFFWHQIGSNKIEKSAKIIVQDWCNSEKLGAPEEFVFDKRYNATCGGYDFELGEYTGGAPALFVSYSVKDGKKDSPREAILLPSTPMEARVIISKIRF